MPKSGDAGMVEFTGSVSPIQRARPKHDRLRSHLLGEIAIGRLQPGDALPSEKQLAEMLRFSRHTVRQALGELEREGLVERLQGKGTFVVDRPTEATAMRTSSFAMVVSEVSTGYYPSLLAEFERAARKAGRPTVICNTTNDSAQQGDHLMHLIHSRVAGVALNPCSPKVTPAYHVQVVQDSGIPVVLLHRSVPEVQAPVLVVPFREVGYRAGKLITEAGHCRVAFFSSSRSSSIEGFEEGFRAALRESGLDLPDELIDDGQLNSCAPDDYRTYEKHLEDSLARMMRTPNRPTALFTTFDSWAEMIFLVAGKLGLRIPEDLSIVSYGGTRRDGAIMRRLTAITIDEAEEARLAVQLLVEMCDGRRAMRSSEEMVLSLGVSLGETLASPSAV